MLSEIKRDSFKTRFLHVTSDSSVNEQPRAMATSSLSQDIPFVSGPAEGRFKDDLDHTLALTLSVVTLKLPPGS